MELTLMDVYDYHINNVDIMRKKLAENENNPGIVSRMIVINCKQQIEFHTTAAQAIWDHIA